MTAGDKVIYFKPTKSSIGGGHMKFEAQLLKLCKAQAIIMLLNGEKKRVMKENLEKVK